MKNDIKINLQNGMLFFENEKKYFKQLLMKMLSEKKEAIFLLFTDNLQDEEIKTIMSLTKERNVLISSEWDTSLLDKGSNLVILSDKKNNLKDTCSYLHKNIGSTKIFVFDFFKDSSDISPFFKHNRNQTTAFQLVSGLRSYKEKKPIVFSVDSLKISSLTTRNEGLFLSIVSNENRNYKIPVDSKEPFKKIEIN